jgi:hypothetical protein
MELLKKKLAAQPLYSIRRLFGEGRGKIKDLVPCRALGVNGSRLQLLRRGNVVGQRGFELPVSCFQILIEDDDVKVALDGAWNKGGREGGGGGVSEVGDIRQGKKALRR